MASVALMKVTKQFHADFAVLCAHTIADDLEIEDMRAMVRAKPDQWIPQITYSANDLGLPSDDINRRMKASLELEKYWNDYDEVERFDLMKKND